MGLWTRMKRSLRAAFGGLVESTENPELILQQTIRDMRDRVPELNNSVAQVMATEKLLAKNKERLETQVVDDFEEETTTGLKDKWERWGAGIRLVVLPSPYRELTRPIVRYINEVARENADEIITVVLPEFIPARWWQHVLHNQSSLLLKASLLFRKGVIVTSVPYHLEK